MKPRLDAGRIIIIGFDPVFAPLLENHIALTSRSIPAKLKQVLAKRLRRYASTFVRTSFVSAWKACGRGVATAKT